jgi:hypothetical protein
MATEKLFWSVEPARSPMEITLLWRDSVLIRRELLVTVLALTELSVSALLHVIALLTPDVST